MTSAILYNGLQWNQAPDLLRNETSRIDSLCPSNQFKCRCYTLICHSNIQNKRWKIKHGLNMQILLWKQQHCLNKAVHFNTVQYKWYRTLPTDTLQYRGHWHGRTTDQTRGNILNIWQTDQVVIYRGETLIKEETHTYKNICTIHFKSHPLHFSEQETLNT